MRQAAEAAETDEFNPAIDAASGAAADALQNGKIKNKVLKLTGEVQVLKIKLAQAQASGADTSDIEDKITEEQCVFPLSWRFALWTWTDGACVFAQDQAYEEHPDRQGQRRRRLQGRCVKRPFPSESRLPDPMFSVPHISSSCDTPRCTSPLCLLQRNTLYR